MALVCSTATIFGQSGQEENPGKNNHPRSAGCAPAVQITEMAFNNVRALIEVPGTMWLDRPRGTSAYFVPKPPDGERGPTALSSGSLWLGGVDAGGNLKLAAMLQRQRGNDYWAGPLTTDGSATILPGECVKYDRHFYISRQMVELHRLYFQRLAYDQEHGTETVNDPPFHEEPYQIPEEILNWPAHGDVGLGQDFYLAPFIDNPDGTGTAGLYEPELGDYPWYDLEQSEEDCLNRNRTSPIPLYGDHTLWWVFNDKGNIHTESEGQPIGMEIRAQAFAFNTLDEINNFTFYNYTLVNRSTQTLYNTWFAKWVNPALGNPDDDYIGCDVQRGMGYCYNGNNNDEDNAGNIGYGVQPPAVGIDFFEGPYQDADGTDNPGPNSFDPTSAIPCEEALAGAGIPYAGLGIGYGDGIVDNERFGMRRFISHNIGTGSSATQGPVTAEHYYNMMRGLWRDGSPILFGGSGHESGGIPAHYMFPGNSDPLHWGTGCMDPQNENWTEMTENNAPGNRRFIQSAGPFTLAPGDYNNVTLGVCWARANSGGPLASVELLRLVDDKAQALFDNCFRILNGPDAPELTCQELDREIILYLDNPVPSSNNYREMYKELDPTIPAFSFELDSMGQAIPDSKTPNDTYYRFQGYRIFQLRDENVSVADLGNPQLAREIFQVDVKDNVDKLINYELDPDMLLPVPKLMVQGANEGIRHSFRVTHDAFASGDDRLVNFKRYYFVAIAYASNQFASFDPMLGTGQSTEYLAGRKSTTGGVFPITCIPHIPSPTAGGTVVNAPFGTRFSLTRIEGEGNGGNILELTKSSEEEIMAGEPWRVERLTYTRNGSPVHIKVVDPLNVRPGNFELRMFNEFNEIVGGVPQYTSVIDSARWVLVNKDIGEEIFSRRGIEFQTEQIIPEYGISIDMHQYQYDVNEDGEPRADLLTWDISFENNLPWLSGIPDTDDFTLQNWIMSGTGQEVFDTAAYGGMPCFRLLDANGVQIPGGPIDPGFFDDLATIDGDRIYNGIFNGQIAPFRLVRPYDCGPSPLVEATKPSELIDQPGVQQSLTELVSIDLVFTPNKDLWTRVPVLEMQSNPALAEGGAPKLTTRRSPSVDKNGNPTPAGVTQPSDNPGDPNFIHAEGMGWFPGYAIDIESGERLNMAFGEDSFLADDNGRDMLWNPSDRIYGFPGGEEIFGAQHYIYVFRNARKLSEANNTMPMYDYGKFLRENLNFTVQPFYRRLWRNCSWIMAPLAAGLKSVEEGLVPAEARLRIRVAKPYRKYAPLTELGELNYATLGSVLNPLNPNLLGQSQNDWYPMYEFSIESEQTIHNDADALEEALALINVVPNPYHAFNAYERNRVENLVKFVNLPQECTIKIYNLSGTLVRTLGKDNPQTFLDWDIRNEARIPLASGVYIIHVDVPGVGERVLKWFCVMRPLDLTSF
ncbi:MAG: T9SS C-terminal target domain-containing protein [Cryomorphaceae bacterium]|nr:MAG: T9SS C-terminal target domain-containing protein [Cryomorphaceae bacterium]